MTLKSFSRLLVSLMATGLIFAATAVLAGEHTKDSLKQVKENLEADKAMLIDVREQDEWDSGHVQGATFLPLSDLNGKLTEKQQKKISKEKILYLHCRSGGRCLIAGEILAKQGYQVRCLKPGYQDLISAGFEKAKD
ncbi:MAG: rhodanese-like domain-containing protein [Planctomycetaceae bacterium]|nr:rhodanese-like domain-containing protein [Planctomycetaceae bacterium]